MHSGYMCAMHSSMTHWHVTGPPPVGHGDVRSSHTLALAYCGRRQARNRSIAKDFGS
jgi:hypothetical protein